MGGVEIFLVNGVVLWAVIADDGFDVGVVVIEFEFDKGLFIWGIFHAVRDDVGEDFVEAEVEGVMDIAIDVLGFRKAFYVCCEGSKFI